MHTIEVQKPGGKYRVVIKFPSGKQEIRWANSRQQLEEICAEWKIPFSTIRWTSMK